MAKMSIVGLLLADNTIFDNMVLPTGVDHDLVVSNICNECYDLGVYQPDPDYMKFAIATWSRRKLWSWNKLYETLNFTYNPIWNKDGTITETETRETSGTDGGTLTTGGTVSNTGTITDDGDGTETGTITDDGEGTETGTITDNGSENVTRGTDTDRTYKQRGFNDSGLVSNRSEEEHVDETVGTTTSNTRTLNTASTADNVRTLNTASTANNVRTLNTLETSNNTTTDSRTRAGSEDITRSRTEQGNIGVTTTQQMIQEERDISMFDLVDHITQDFKEQFCIMVY